MEAMGSLARGVAWVHRYGTSEFDHLNVDGAAFFKELERLLAIKEWICGFNRDEEFVIRGALESL